ncbi:short-chain dehydrogenase/reductase [Frondihabitans sucicola]|uniref:Short-chain dehydrogenase/reductase n=1 Tax=Frondihabitans sucicola TaxID=1268041 RepID=A0ABM8GJ66_9MICO|nr:SDR family NAD(P)-dependent oxidoreductase [Frondihabitans sucicola]BDZ48403.1 short-chain dehydrogenase/reductase [Frondihabitans sucicola]
MTTGSDTVYFVTGSSRGLGRAIAEAVVAAGHRLVATARDPRSLDDLVAANPDRVRAVALDVADPAAVDAAVATAVDAFGHLDVVVNNAGYADLGSVEDTTLESFRRQLDTNLVGVIAVTKAVLPLLRKQGSGRIIQISSVGGRSATPGLAAYQAAKWAVGGFTEVLAKEIAPLGLFATAIEPGGMRTDWAGSSMAVAPVTPGYEPTVGAMAALHEGSAIGASDPAKVAQLVLTVAGLDSPPVRLLAGSDAVTNATRNAAALMESDAAWRSLSESTDADDATPEQLDPLAEHV